MWRAAGAPRHPSQPLIPTAQTIGTFLDTAAANPNTINNQLTALDTQINGASGVRAQIASLRATLAAQQTNATAFSTGVSALSTVVSTLNGYSTNLNTLGTEFTNLLAGTDP